MKMTKMKMKKKKIVKNRLSIKKRKRRGWKGNGKIFSKEHILDLNPIVDVPLRRPKIIGEKEIFINGQIHKIKVYEPGNAAGLLRPDEVRMEWNAGGGKGDLDWYDGNFI